MIFIVSIVILLLVPNGSLRLVVDTGNPDVDPWLNGPIADLIYEQIRKFDVRANHLRSRRDYPSSDENSGLGVLNSTESKVAYERAINQTIADYYAQRKAVMDRYYARQREIREKFAGKTTTEQARTVIADPTTPRVVRDDFSVPEVSTVTDTIFKDEKNVQHPGNSIAIDETTAANGDKNRSPIPWIYRSRKDLESEKNSTAETDLESEASYNVPLRVRNAEAIPGYYRLGEFQDSKGEKIVYQHNLAVGLKGSSQLEAKFEAVLEGPFAITAIEAFPFGNTRANFSWIAGGPGKNFVKLNLKGYKNEGFSYVIKIWGVPI